MSSSDDIILIEKAVAGDVASSKLLFYSNHKRLLAHIQKDFPRELNGAFDPNDILQDVWVRALMKFSTFRGTTRGELYNWLKTIARNIIRDRVRHLQLDGRNGKRTINEENASDSTIVTLLEEMAIYEKTPSKSAASHELIIALGSAISQLPVDQAEVIRLRYLAGLDLSAVAEHMKRSTGAVTALCFRAIRSLRDELLSKSNYV